MARPKKTMAEDMAKAVQKAVAEGKSNSDIMRIIKEWNKKIGDEQEGGDACSK